MDQGHWPTDVKVVICGHTIPEDVSKISSSLGTFLFAKTSCYLCVSQLFLIASIGSAVHTTLLANEIKSNQQKDKLHNRRVAVYCTLCTCVLYTVCCSQHSGMRQLCCGNFLSLAPPSASPQKAVFSLPSFQASPLLTALQYYPLLVGLSSRITYITRVMNIVSPHLKGLATALGQ